jgi:adenylyltransferase/sulfurtransferase
MSQTNFSQEEIRRYSRHFSLPNVGLAGQKRLKDAKVLCVGTGGLGSPLLLYLAAAGVGTLGLIDGDVVEASNLQRQIIFTTADQGQSKVLAAASHLNALNPSVTIQPHFTPLTIANALAIIEQYDIVVDGSDNFPTRYLVNDACYHQKKPLVYASIFQFEGQASIFNANQGPCYRCLYRTSPPPELMPNCAEAGVFGVLPGIMGTIQATETIKFILGIGQSLSGRLLLFNALTMQFKEITIHKDKECVLCAQQTPFLDLERPQISCQSDSKNPVPVTEISARELKILKEGQTDFTLVDVRQPYEHEIVNIGGILIPLGELPQRCQELNKNQNIIVYCKLGQRSARAAEMLQAQGFKHVKSLTGGILQWIKEIDRNLPIY